MKHTLRADKIIAEQMLVAERLNDLVCLNPSTETVAEKRELLSHFSVLIGDEFAAL